MTRNHLRAAGGDALEAIEMLALVASVYDEWNEGNLGYVFGVLTPPPDLAPSEAASLAELRRMLVLLKSAFPDLEITQTASQVRGETVVERIIALGSHCGEVRGVAPTDSPVVITATNIWHWREGRLVRIEAPELSAAVTAILDTEGGDLRPN